MLTLSLFLLFTHPFGVLGVLALIFLVGTVGIATQTNLGALTPQSWGQMMMFDGPQYVADATAGAHTLPVGAMTVSLDVTVAMTAAGAVNITTRTAAQLWADITAQIGFQPPSGLTALFTINNTGGGTITLVGGAGVTINGTATVANNTSRSWQVTFNSATSIVLQNLYSGTA